MEAAVVGDGPAVLLIHGIPGSWRQAMPLANDLADRHTVVLPSRPGYGETPLATGRTPGEQAAAYAALLDTLGLDRAAVVGISGGGPSAVAFAQEFAPRTTALALCCALAPHLTVVERGMRMMLRIPPAVVGRLAALQRRRERRALLDPATIDRRMASELTAAEFALSKDDPRIRDDLIVFMHSHLDAPPGLRGLRNDLAQIDHELRHGPPATDNIVAPTLVLHGDADTVVPMSHAHHYVEAIPHASFEVYEGAGHIFLLTHRSRFTARLRDFLRQAHS
jgi:pimeloyl-ACP methyl ester carboxylesterase